MTISPGSAALHCPYTQCRKSFEKPIVLTDTTKLLRETFYACPHCHCKLDVLVDRKSGSVISITTAQIPADLPPAQCKHHLGYLKVLGEETPIPDECAICPKMVKCFVEKPQDGRSYLSQTMVCSRSKCRRSFSQPIEVTVQAGVHTETYYACPRCFSRVIYRPSY